jgi:hypothetical protein
MSTSANVPVLGERLAVAVAGVVAYDPHARFKKLAAELLRTLENMCAYADRGDWPACAVIEVRTSALVREVGRLADADPRLHVGYRELLTLAVATTEALLVQCRETRESLSAAVRAQDCRGAPHPDRYRAVR